MGKLKEQLITEQEEAANRSANITLYSIASVKGYNYAQEYDPNSGVTQDKNGYHYLKQGYIAGFLAGFTYKLTGDLDD